MPLGSLPLTILFPHRQPGRLLASLLLALPAAGWLLPARAVEAVRHQEAAAVALADGRRLYREQHWLYREDGSSRRLVLYACPGSDAVFARKRVWAGAAGAIDPDFEFEDARSGYVERVAASGGGRELRIREGQGRAERKQRVADADGGVVDAGFDAWIRRHWDAVATGAAVRAPFLVPARAGWFEVKATGARRTMLDGQPALRLRLALDSWLAFVAPEIELHYALADRRLLRFAGPGTIRDAKGRGIPVRIDFPQPPRAADASALAHAQSRPLISTCPG
jgi:hypothetical protein